MYSEHMFKFTYDANSSPRNNPSLTFTAPKISIGGNKFYVDDDSFSEEIC